MHQFLVSLLYQSLLGCKTVVTPCFADEKVKSALLVVIYYNDGGIRKELRIKDEIAAKWGNLATLLGFGDAKKQTIQSGSFYQDDKCTTKMLEEWMRIEVHHTWRKLILEMRKVELGTPAENLAKALRNKDN